MQSPLTPRRAIGAIQVYYPDGMQSIPIPAGEEILEAAMTAHDMWEAEQERVRVRVIRFLGDGKQTCVCHLPPASEEWSP